MDIRGILFDSGDTLVFPKTGSWWPGPDFSSILLRYGIDTDLNTDTMRDALEEGLQYLNANHRVNTVEEEKEQFREFYRIICRYPEIIANDNLLKDLACAYVEKCNFSLYPDTIHGLNELVKNGITLGIVSDAWPSLHNKYLSLGIRHYFKSFTISSIVGCSKPGELIYRNAVSEIGIAPENLLFVDDDLNNVKAAVRLGINGIVMIRDKPYDSEVPIVRELRGILSYIS